MYKYFFSTNKRSHAPSRGRSPLIQAVPWFARFQGVGGSPPLQLVSRWTLPSSEPSHAPSRGRSPLIQAVPWFA